jgi:NADPH:quinone reductase-like Zn-dependent oxidoreductase
VLELLAQGTISAQIAREFPLTEAAAALRFAEEAGAGGKVVLVPGAE